MGLAPASDRPGGAHVFDVTCSLLGQPWRWRPALDGLAEALARQSGVDPAVARVLAARGVAPEEAPRTLAPTLRDWLPDPSIFRDMDSAAARLARAVQQGQSITIFGDYDVDGATASALLIRFLRAVGAQAGVYIPDRLAEGYGPNAPALEQLKADGADLVITVDCGVQSFAALEAAQAAGLDVIVADHHKAGWALPPACAIVNPNRLDEDPQAARFGYLAAVGVAFLLAVATNRLLREARGGVPQAMLLGLLDLVALGTVADVVPLVGLNRAFVAQGLKVMARRDNPGLTALADVAGLDRAPGAGHLGFHLGPRINAGGRVGKSDLGVRLLTSDDPTEVQRLAAELDALNAERRAIEAQVLEAAQAQCDAAGAVVIAADAGWHPGVIGIVAGRLKDAHHKPAVVVALDPRSGLGKGSARSIAGVDIGGAVIAAREAGLLEAGGGHAMAAGLTVRADRLADFAAFLQAHVAGDVARAQQERGLLIDFALSVQGAAPALIEALEAAGPYGSGWPGPKAAVGPARIVKADVVGSDHLRLILQGDDGGRIKAMAFRQAGSDMGAALLAATGRSIYVAGRLVRDDWGGTAKAEIHLEDAAWA